MQRPEKLKNNPGRLSAGVVKIRRGETMGGEPFFREEIDVAGLLQSTLEAAGERVLRDGEWVELAASGFELRPLFAGYRPSADGALGTTTTVEIHHPALIPGGVFEYQHSHGVTLAEAVRRGFDDWRQLDLSVLVDALRGPAGKMPAAEWLYEVGGGRKLVRRAILGPVARWGGQAPAVRARANVIGDFGGSAPKEEHSFCRCCLFTKSISAFRPLLAEDRFHALRLFGARDAEGRPQVDCRVDGEEYEEGKRALLEYVKTWPGTGFDQRKQYVTIVSRFEG